MSIKKKTKRKEKKMRAGCKVGRAMHGLKDIGEPKNIEAK